MSVRTAYRPRTNPRMRGLGATPIFQLEQQMDSAQAALANAQTAGDAAGVAAANATIANLGAQMLAFYNSGSTPTPAPAPVPTICPAWGCGPPPAQIAQPIQLQPVQPIDLGGPTTPAPTSTGISSFVSSIPTWGWVAAGVGAIFLFGGGRR